MRFVISFLECVLGLAMVGVIVWGLVALRIEEGDVGNIFFVYALIGLFMWAVLIGGIYVVVDAYRRGNST